MTPINDGKHESFLIRLRGSFSTKIGKAFPKGNGNFISTQKRIWAKTMKFLETLAKNKLVEVLVGQKGIMTMARDLVLLIKRIIGEKEISYDYRKKEIR